MADAEQAVLTGRAWSEFCQALDRAGQVMRRDTAPATPLNRAEGYRCLTRLLREMNDNGTLTIVVAESDPGWGNWIDTAGYSSGTALLRWLGADTHPLPRCRVTTLAEAT